MPLDKVIQPKLTDESLISCSSLPLVPCKGHLLAKFYWNLEALGAGDEVHAGSQDSDQVGAGRSRQQTEHRELLAQIELSQKIISSAYGRRAGSRHC